MRFDDKAKHFDIDEVEVAEVPRSPHPLTRTQPSSSTPSTSGSKDVADGGEDFASRTKLARRVPELVPLIVGARLKERDGAIGIPDDQVKHVADT